MDSSSTQLSWNDETPHDGTIYHKDKRSLTVTSLVALKGCFFKDSRFNSSYFQHHYAI